MRHLSLLANRRGTDLIVYEEPIPGAEYILGADAAYGEGEKRTLGDMSTLCVARRLWPMGLVQAAEGHGRHETGSFGEIVSAVGAMYNHAWINIERNISHGAKSALKRSGYPLERWYIPPVANIREDESPVYFFHKSLATQKFLTDTFIDYLMQNLFTLKSKALLYELASLQKDKRGLIMTGGKDRSIAAMMVSIVDATIGSTQAPPEKEIVAPASAPWGEDVELWKKSQPDQGKVESDASGWGDVTEMGESPGRASSGAWDGVPEFTEDVGGEL